MVGDEASAAENSPVGRHGRRVATPHPPAWSGFLLPTERSAVFVTSLHVCSSARGHLLATWTVFGQRPLVLISLKRQVFEGDNSRASSRKADLWEPASRTCADTLWLQSMTEPILANGPGEFALEALQIEWTV